MSNCLLPHNHVAVFKYENLCQKEYIQCFNKFDMKLTEMINEDD
jgi:hypothetical protein